MADDDLGTTVIVSDSVTYDAVKGPAPGSAAVLAARLEVMPNLDLGRILVDPERTNGLLYVAARGVAGSTRPKGLSCKRMATVRPEQDPSLSAQAWRAAAAPEEGAWPMSTPARRSDPTAGAFENPKMRKSFHG